MKIKESLRWSSLNQLSKQFLNIVFSVILMRLLSPSDYGLIAMVVVITGLSSILLDFGLGVVIIQNDKLNEKNYSSIFWFNVGIGTLLTIFVAIGGKFLSSFYEEPQIITITGILSLNYLFASVLLVHRSLMIKKLDFDKIAKIEISTVLISGITSIILASFGWGVFSLVLKELLSVILLASFFWIVSPWRPKLYFSWVDLKPVFKLSSSMLINSLFTYAANNLEKIIIGKFFGKQSLGIYSSIQNYSTIPTKSVAKIFSTVLFPTYSKMKSNPDRIAKMHLDVIIVSSLIFFPIFLILSVNAEFLISTILGKEWIDGAVFVKIFSIMGGFVLLNSFTGSFLQAMGRADLIIKDAFIKKTLIILMITICSFKSVIAIAIGRLIAEVLNLGYSFYQAKKTVSLSFLIQFAKILKILISFIPFLLLYWFVLINTVSGLILLMVSGLLCPLMFYLTIFIVDRSSIILLATIVKKAITK